ncbi:/ arcA / Arginine deiminase /:228950 Forward [Candidatus Hepatoplasma crinochetorum]|uniref:Arginine deiminase n=1 Tax=Candidatus Hepatoplasma crinochetorum TaxID=295596 RepID=A0A0G7ZNQ2_9MOLU|nr:/ arcA / Arginine deiminase /:228950 Forward [Candidatus Hepatoplasma crinochetorum]
MINVNSEYKKLKKVLLHRPGWETENLTPSTYERLLFDDSYYLKEAQREHDAFAELLRNKGVEVFYLEKLIADTISISKQIKENFLKEFIIEGEISHHSHLFIRVKKYLDSFKDNRELIVKLMAGIRFSELPEVVGKKSLRELESSNVWALDPLPNLIFTRDPFASLGNGATIHKMTFKTRRRETKFAEYIFKYHPDYKNTSLYYTRNRSTTIEGGDIMILSKTDIAVGISQRTQADSLEKLAHNLFNDKKSKVQRIWGISIPKGRSWMHLDTVFTQIDINKFAIFSNYKFEIFKLVKIRNDIKITSEKMTIDQLMSKVFGIKKITLIHCGGGDPVHSEREQWNDGSNVLAIAPNEVIAYDRNHITNDLMRKNGVIVHEIPSYELSRGRGGPRCMSMPLERED